MAIGWIMAAALAYSVAKDQGWLGGDNTSTTRIEDIQDPATKAAIEMQTKIAGEQWDMYKEYFQQYEIEAAKANADLLPYVSELSKKTIEEQTRQLGLNKPLEDALRKYGIAATEEQIRNIPLDRELNEALRAAGIAVTKEQMRDLKLDRPLRDALRTEALRDLKLDRPLRDALRRANILATEEQIRNIPLDRSLNDALRAAGIAFTEEQIRDLKLNRPLKDALRSANIEAIAREQRIMGRLENELDLAQPAVRKFYEESLKGVDIEKRADEAGANVASMLRNEMASMGRELSRYGIDPGSSRFESALAEKGVRAAELIAGARNRAVAEGERENYGRLTNVMGIRPQVEDFRPTLPQGTGITMPTTVPGTPVMTQPQGVTSGGMPASPGQVGITRPGASPLPQAPGMRSAPTSFAVPDPYARAAGGYESLASRVLGKTVTTENADFWDFAGNVAGQGLGAYAGAYGTQLGRNAANKKTGIQPYSYIQGPQSYNYSSGPPVSAGSGYVPSY